MQVENNSSYIHVDLDFTHRLELMDELQEFVIETSSIANQVITTTNTIDKELKMVQLLIHIENKNHDIFPYIYRSIKDLIEHSEAELVNIYHMINT